MGYDGAPSLGDLEEVSISHAVEAYHRIVEAGRQFFLALHGQPRFQQLGLVPYSGYHRILRDGTSESPTAGAVYFETTVLLSLYRDSAWPTTRVVFASIFLGPKEAPEINVGLGDVRERGESMAYRWAHAGEPDESADIGRLAAVDKARFPYVAVYEPDARWIYDSHPWVSGRPDEDLTWAATRLEAAKAAWTSLLESIGSLPKQQRRGAP